jgi:hypothetical protein
MNSLLIAALAFVSLTIAHATELEVRILKLSGEQVPPGDIIRLSNAGVLPSTASFTTFIHRDGTFEHSAVKPLSHAAFDDAAKPGATKNQSTGFSFSGRETAAGDIHSVHLEFATTTFDSVRMQRTDSGDVIARPVFRTHKINWSAELPIDSWVVVPIRTVSNEPQTVFLLRIRSDRSL